MFKRSAFSAACAAAFIAVPSSIALAAPYQAGEVEIIVHRDNDTLEGYDIRVGGTSVGRTNAAGKLRFARAAGLQELVVVGPEGRVAFTEFKLAPENAAEIAITLHQDRRPTDVVTQVFTPDDDLRYPLEGSLLDSDGKPVAGARVRAKGRVVTTLTAADGSFRLELPRGSHDLDVTLPNGEVKGFAALNASPLITVTPVLQLPPAVPVASATSAAAPAASMPEAALPPPVAAAKPATPEAAPKGAVELERVVVKAAPTRRSAVAQERQAATVVDTVTQEEIAAAGDADAGAAIKRVTGVTVQNNVIIVRGLSDRYSSTLVNGAEIPSPNPSRRVVPLDIFPTDLLGGLSVQKTYSANLPGDFSGGAALLESRPIPTVNKGSAKLKLGGNSRTTFLNTLTHARSDTDHLGFDDGLRDVPSTINQLTDGNRLRLTSLTENQRRSAAASLPNVWEVQVQERTMPDVGGSLSYGGRVKDFAEGVEIGYSIAGLYDYNTRFRREFRNDLRPGAETVSIRDTQNQERTIQTVDTGLVGGLNVKLSKSHQLDYIGLLSRNTEKGSFFTQALFNENFPRQDQRTLLDFIETQLAYNQLTGKHRLPTETDLRLKWQLAYASADRDVRDRRSYSLFRNEDSGDRLYRLAILSGEGDLPQREWEYLSDTSLDGGIDIEAPLLIESGDHGFSFKGGVRATRKERDLSTIRYSYFNPGSQQSQAFEAARLLPSPEFILVDQFFGAGGFDIRNANSQGVGGGNSEAYTGTQDVDAAYGTVEWTFGKKYRVDLGLRVEQSNIAVITGDPRQGPTTPVSRDTTDYLPALNATWFLSPARQLRFGYSQTVNRPQFRELADVQFLDPETRFISFGNAALQQSEITNYDLRLEQYWSNNSAISSAIFYKQFDKPIEQTVQSDSSGNPVRSFTNSPSAIDYGIEIDGRYGLEVLNTLHPKLGNLYVSGNVSVIKSEVSLANGRKRALQGQSPYIINLTLGYNDPGRTDATLLINMFGERINEVGFDGLPDAKEQAYPVLDFNLRQTLSSHFKLGFKARNLLDPTIRVKQGNIDQRSYQLGRSFGLSAEYEF